MNLNRRSFLQRGLAALAFAGTAPSLLLAEALGTHKLDTIGIIGGVPKDMRKDWKKSLRLMADIGYKTLESGPWGPPEEFLGFLRQTGLELVSCGANFQKTLAPDWLDQARKVQAKYAIAYSPWLYPLDKITLPQLKENADLLNQAGEKAKAAGLQLAVHNHYQEFTSLNGKPIFDQLLDLTDPNLVKVEMDLCWVARGGGDPVDYLKRYPGRIELFHVKDLGKAPEYAMVPVGAGTIDFARIFAAARVAGVKHYIVELEGPANTSQVAAQSFRYLSHLTF